MEVNYLRISRFVGLTIGEILTDGGGGGSDIALTIVSLTDTGFTARFTLNQGTGPYTATANWAVSVTK